MKKRNMMIRIIAIFLCVLMAAGAMVVGFSVFGKAAGIMPDTGSNDKSNMIYVVLVTVAVVVAIVCVILSKTAKKSKENEAE